MAADFDSMVADDQQAPAPTMQPTVNSGGSTTSFDDMQDDTEKFGTPGMAALAGVEGAVHGLGGPAADWLETKVLGIKPETIRGLREANPIVHGIADVGGLGAGLLTGTGEAALMTKAGELASSAVGGMEAIKAAELGVDAAKAAGKGLPEAQAALKAAKSTTPLSFKVGDSVVKNAAEMAVLQGSDEVSKQILNDPNTSAESAISNIGLAAALGGAGGAFMTGAVSPLWEATAGPKVEQLLGAVKDHFSGGKAMLPDELKSAAQTLGVDIDAPLQAAMSGNPTAANSWGILREGQHKSVTDALNKWETESSESIANSLGVKPEDVAVHSENQAGHDLKDVWKKEYDAKYGPVANAMDKRNAEAAGIAISDDARLDKYGKLLEDGMQKYGTDSPVYKLYPEWGNRLLAKENIGGLDQLKTELNGEIKKAFRAGDDNTAVALKDIRSSLHDFQENQITSQAETLFKNGVGEARQLSADLLNKRAEANRSYKEFAEMSNELSDHLGTGDFKGAGRLKGKITDATPEQLLNKFSIKGNADFIPFLKERFPETYTKVIDNERKNFLKSSVLTAKGEAPINIKKLNSVIEKAMAGQPEYVKAIMPQDALQKIAAANKLNEAIPAHKSSGTAGWMTKMFGDMPRSVLAGVAMLSGHNPLIGGLLGEMSQRLGRDAPDAIRLAHLKFMASDQPVSAKGFKAMTDFFHNTYKAESKITKAVDSVFKGGTSNVIALPSAADRAGLDKIVTKMQNNPSLVAKSQQGQTGDYLPQHQQALAATSTTALTYLQSLKPQPHVLGPLDKKVEPQPSEVARYNRALNIAQNPTVVMSHIKDGTLLPTDIADLHNMYPGLYQKMVTQMANQMNAVHSEDRIIPYKTRLSMSLFMGAPTDVTMQPASIVAAQPKPKMPQGPQQQAQSGGKSMKSLGKSVPSYMTPTQSAESHKNSRD